jgi:hypothetical protein
MFVILGLTSMPAMSSMKHVQERTKKQQNVGQGAKQMRLMFFPKEKESDRGKS